MTSYNIETYIEKTIIYFDKKRKPLDKPWYDYNSIPDWLLFSQVVQEYYRESGFQLVSKEHFKKFVEDNEKTFYYDLHYILQKTDRKLLIRDKHY